MSSSTSLPITSASPEASLVICTRNHASRLGQCLESLEHLDLTDAELVFVNNGSEDCTGEILGKWWHPEPRHILIEAKAILDWRKTTWALERRGRGADHTTTHAKDGSRCPPKN